MTTCKTNDMHDNRLQKALMMTGMAAAMLLFAGKTTAQSSGLMIRVAKLVIHPQKLEAYKAALREEIDTAIRLEPGVLSLYAVYDKNEPAHVTVFEIYANETAYQSHILTPHFLKYKQAVADMVRSLELSDMSPIRLGSKFQSPDKN